MVRVESERGGRESPLYVHRGSISKWLCKGCGTLSSGLADDLDIAPDFFSYFSATKWLLDNDPTIWCVSAWNDNGKEGYVSGSGKCTHGSRGEFHKLLEHSSGAMKSRF